MKTCPPGNFEETEMFDFWESPTLEELAQSQQVQPMEDVRSLFGTWPGDEDDDFEAIIYEWRHMCAVTGTD